jgi:peptidase E
MGGGGFSMETAESARDAFIVDLARARHPRPNRPAARQRRPLPRICFIGTASGDSLEYWLRFQAAFSGRAEPSRLTLFDRTVVDLEAFLLDKDAIYVGGGNTASLLAVWRAHAVDRALARASDEGVVLAGISAGAICWFESGTTDSFGPTLEALTGGLGWLAGSCCPHYNGEVQRRPTFHRLVGDGTLPAGIAIDDGAAAVFDGADLVEVVATHPGVTAYRVEPTAGAGVTETPLPARVLG